MTNPREGWYPDPADATMLRWWDGKAWTHQVRARPGQTSDGSELPTEAQQAASEPTTAASSDAVASVDPLAEATAAEPAALAESASAQSITPSAAEPKVPTTPAETESKSEPEVATPAESKSEPEVATPPESESDDATEPTTRIRAIPPQSAPSANPNDDLFDAVDDDSMGPLDEEDLFALQSRRDHVAQPKGRAAKSAPTSMAPESSDEEEDLFASAAASVGGSGETETNDDQLRSIGSPKPLWAEAGKDEDEEKRRPALLWLLGLLAVVGIGVVAYLALSGGDDETGPTTTTDGQTTDPGDPTTQPVETPTTATEEAPTEIVRPTSIPFDPSTTALGPRIVIVEAAGCGVVETATAALVSDGFAITSQQAVTRAEISAITIDGDSIPATYLGITADGIAVLAVGADPGAEATIGLPIDGDEAGIIYRSPTGPVTVDVGTIRDIEDSSFLVSGNLTDDARGGLVFDRADNLLGVVRRVENGEAVVARSGASLTDVATPEGPGCNDAANNPPTASYETVQNIQDESVRSFALIQLYLASLANEDWDTAGRLDEVAAEWDDDRLAGAFGQWHRAVALPLQQPDPLTWEIGLVLQEDRDGTLVTVLQCATFRVDPVALTITNITEAPLLTVKVADEWVDTGVQRVRAADFCPG